MNDFDDHRYTNETYSRGNSPIRMVAGLGFVSAGLLASLFLSFSAIDRLPWVAAEIASVVRPYDPVARYQSVRTLWDQKLDRLIENLTPD